MHQICKGGQGVLPPDITFLSSGTQLYPRSVTALFSLCFVSKPQLQPYEPQLFRLCVQCLAAVANALPPDHSDTGYKSQAEGKASADTDGQFDPQPIDTSK